MPVASVEPLCQYLSLLARWSARANLTGATDAAGRVRVLVEPVLAVTASVEPPDLIDVGSGNGSPGLVLALLRPELAVTLLEPRLRRWAFLREVLRTLGRTDVWLERSRHDEHLGSPAQTVTLRALRLGLDELVPLLRPGGRVVVLGARPQATGRFLRETGGPAGTHLFRLPR